MNKAFFIAVAAILSTAPLTSARAVNIENQDSQDYQMIIETDGGDAMEIEISAGQNVDNVCDACYIHFGEYEPFPAEGDEVILITDGQLSIRN